MRYVRFSYLPLSELRVLQLSLPGLRSLNTYPTDKPPSTMGPPLLSAAGLRALLASAPGAPATPQAAARAQRSVGQPQP